MSEEKILMEMWKSFCEKYLQGEKLITPYRDPNRLKKEIDFELAGESKNPVERQLYEILEKSSVFSPSSQDPNLMGYLYANPDLVGIIGDWFVTLVNTNVHTYDASPVFTMAEHVVSRNLAQLSGFDSNADGVFCPGGSYSNMLAIFMAKKNALRRGARLEQLVLFTSEHSHYSIDKSAALTGILKENVRKIECDKLGRMNVEKLQFEIDNSVSNNQFPFMVCATAGTTVLGSIDPINSIAELLKDFTNIWLHVDGALCGPVLLSDKHRNLLKGIENADSFSWDFHKALGAPILCSILLASNGTHLKKMFNVQDDYLFHNDSINDELDMGKKTLQCGRRGDAYKLWLMFKIRGFKYYRDFIDQIFSRTKHIIKLLKNLQDVWLVNDSPDSWNVCFWYIPKEIEGFKSIEECGDHEKRIIDEATKRIYQYFKIHNVAQINFASLNGEPACLRLNLAGGKNSIKNIENSIRAIRSIGLMLTSELDQLIISGGDERLRVNKKGYNQYFSSPYPNPLQISRSSCTSSTIKESEFNRLNELMKEIKDGRISFQQAMMNVHDRIRKILKVNDNISVITIPSGTDLEYAAMITAKASFGVDNDLLNIITGEEEIGSNSAIAANGILFSDKAPTGKVFESNTQLEGIGKVEVVKISLRDPDTKKPLDQKKWWFSRIEKMLKKTNTTTLLHIVESSKLGHRIDLMGEIEDLIAQYSKRLLIVIDACQSRTDIRRIRQYLRLGCMVMITGSKFEQSPPFCGALIVPSKITTNLNVEALEEIPSYLKHLISIYDISGPIKNLFERHLHNWMNIGLMLRWTVGLDNWERYRKNDEETRNIRIQEWVEGVISEIGKYKSLKLFSGGEYQPGSIGDTNTIISIQMFRDGIPLNIDSAKRVYHYMAKDITNMIPEKLVNNKTQINTLSTKYIIGQPVDLGKFAVVRIALGARLVSRMVDINLESEFQHDRNLLQKLNLILIFFEEINNK